MAFVKIVSFSKKNSLGNRFWQRVVCFCFWRNCSFVCFFSLFLLIDFKWTFVSKTQFSIEMKCHWAKSKFTKFIKKFIFFSFLISKKQFWCHTINNKIDYEEHWRKSPFLKRFLRIYYCNQLHSDLYICVRLLVWPQQAKWKQRFK